MSKKRAIVETWFQKVWYEEDAKTIDQLFVPDDAKRPKTATGLAKQDVLGPKEFKVFHAALLGLITKTKITIVDYFEQGDWAIVRCSVEAVSRTNTTKSIQMTGSVFVRITKGRIREAHNYFDFLHLFEGLGLLPQHTMQMCLMGKRAV